MKIGRQARSALADRLLEEIPGLDKPHPISEAVALPITGRRKESRRFGKK